MHYQRWAKHGDPLVTKAAANGSGCTTRFGYVVRTENGEQKFEHVRVAEAALGKPLPPGAEVHHVDENRANNAPGNLVICPDRAYHALLHVRTRALAASGNPNFRACRYCKRWDDPSRMKRHRSQNAFWHGACHADYVRTRQRRTNARGSIHA